MLVPERPACYVKTRLRSLPSFRSPQGVPKKHVRPDLFASLCSEGATKDQASFSTHRIRLSFAGTQADWSTVEKQLRLLRYSTILVGEDDCVLEHWA